MTRPGPLILAVSYPYCASMGRVRTAGRGKAKRRLVGSLDVEDPQVESGPPDAPELAHAAALVRLTDKIDHLEDAVRSRVLKLTGEAQTYSRDSGALRSIADELERMLSA